MHTFSVYDFSDKEIDQICTLVDHWGRGAILPIDKRKYTKQVLEYAVGWGLVETKYRRLHFTYGRFNPVHDVPVEALWRLIRPLLNREGATGFSVTKRQEWQFLNIYPEGHKHARQRDFEAKMEVFDRLMQYGYVFFQHAGSVWNISLWKGQL